MRNPAHFEIISTGRYFAHGSSPELTSDNAELIALTERMLGEAARQGLLRQDELKPTQIAARALVYGFARMNLDGHFPRWGVEEGEIEDGRSGDRRLHRRHREAGPRIRRPLVLSEGRTAWRVACS
ncbi:TetR-like C-terminal domain-containing protein [Bradyrhizobium sp. CB82]|uniref:TetR-like C-terminal domain-containing protein n=1 Tax=Bradyrhizobium sp. CB82 TaxID=3039159 RepID=UPI0024B0C957|nr:TetR-like C-terminal domain-containing protein [Bradyrhizobium sp. CB82]WFU43192.1 TetR-like C-terminal domain-containing protein [Bradyrhizobium sp. CB82]